MPPVAGADGDEDEEVDYGADSDAENEGGGGGGGGGSGVGVSDASEVDGLLRASFEQLRLLVAGQQALLSAVR
jgi:hypothetical protein